MRRGKLIVTGIVAVVASAALAGCGSSSKRTSSPSGSVMCLPGPTVSDASDAASRIERANSLRTDLVKA